MMVIREKSETDDNARVLIYRLPVLKESPPVDGKARFFRCPSFTRLLMQFYGSFAVGGSVTVTVLSLCHPPLVP